MQNISKTILNLTSKKLATYLIIYPLIIALIHIVLILVLQSNAIQSEHLNGTLLLSTYIFTGLYVIIATIWLLWLRATTQSVDTPLLGLRLKWFKIAFGLFVFYLVYNLCYNFLINFINSYNADYTWLLYASIEIINSIGLLILYPTICHYSARAIYAKKHARKTTWINALPYTLLLIFLPISIPVFQNHFSPIKTEQKTLVKLYVLGFILIAILFIVGFIAAISGLI
ncbi:hypothetical protein HNV08_07640 [Winogradskyella eckloniae]|uniref:hypothetical protein n=1 Tax=Winogradskyella eckloniae TaxID=1089306 RepID=UPI001566D84B|nr:hypothetical protein [Winogradskyella eckloniae]NRD19915.1 hypothetical protein [Winogradskyella eckloniae]